MKSVFVEHFRPTTEEFTQLWRDSTFIIDANVLLNLYRYSAETRKALEKALKSVENSIFITHQAAKEFLNNRLKETSNQAKEYSDTIKIINDLSDSLLKKNRHPFLPDDELEEFERHSKKWVEALKKQEESLFATLTEDEILDFAEKLFAGKTGQPFNSEELSQIETEGEKRYEKEVPPGYKDIKKISIDDPLRKYGDLIVWKQIIKYAKSKNTSVIFITDDKKDDWWLDQSGRTISPRRELIKEFYIETNQKFWMYTVDKFMQETAKLSQSPISDKVIEEIIEISQDANESIYDKKLDSFLNLDAPSIEIYQDTFDSPIDEWQSGLLYIHLNKPMRYATGTGKFQPSFPIVPGFSVKLIDSPYTNNGHNMVGLSSGCGTTRDFNVHLKAKDGLLEAGTYIVEYTASVEEI